MSEDDLPGRLRKARESAGYRNATEAARSIGVNVVTYTAHENGGREYDRKAARLYGTAFGVDPAWLIFGGPSAEGATSKPMKGGAPLREISVKAPFATPLKSLDDRAAVPVAAVWSIPDEVLKDTLRVSPKDAWIVEVRGDAMFDPSHPAAPGSLFPGDRVIIDASDRSASPPGAFAIFDGETVVVKLAELLFNADPPCIRLTNRNPQYRSYELPRADVAILGRVKGRVTAL